IARGDRGGVTDNKAIIAEMVALRAERARLLGYPSFAHYRLDDTMAKTPQAVRALLERVWAPGRRRALADRGDLQALAQAAGKNFRARAVGRAPLGGEAAQGALRHRRGGGQAVSPARADHRGRVLYREPPVRPDLRASRRRPGLA